MAEYTLYCGLCNQQYDPTIIQRLCQCGRPLLVKYKLTEMGGRPLAAGLSKPSTGTPPVAMGLNESTGTPSLAPGRSKPSTTDTGTPPLAVGLNESTGTPPLAVGSSSVGEVRPTSLNSIIDNSLTAPLKHSIWRYHPLLPVQRIKNIISLGEGQTPLLPARRLGEHLGCPNLFIKDEAVNPSGSFKVRGMSVAISKAIEYGINKFCVPTAGNAGGAAAAYVAAMGGKIRVYMPADSGDVFIDECRQYGAEVTTVDGTIVDAAHKMREQCDPDQWFDLSTLKEPYRLEGKKTMGLELYENFNGELPEVIIYPTGGGTGLIGMWKAFNELEQLGLLGSSRPRLIAIQTEGCAPIQRAFAAGKEFADPWPDPQTDALGLRVPQAVGDFLILRAIRETNGHAVAVSENDWREGVKLLGRYTGIYACPEGGAVLAGLLHLLGEKIIDPTSGVVLFNTGTGFKYQHVL